MRCLIFANGEIKNYDRHKKYIKGDEYIICADGGAQHVRNLQLIPNLIIGDLDSIPFNLLEEFREMGIEIKEFPMEKDEVDTELALNEAMRLNPRELFIMGAVGSRIDHTMANIQLLIRPVMKGINSCVISDRHIISLITPSFPATIEGKQGDLLSLLPLSTTVRGVETEGLKWNLQDSTFKFGHPYGISNVLLENKADIKVKEGIMALIRILEEV